MDPLITMEYRANAVRQLDLLVFQNEQLVCSGVPRLCIQQVVVDWEFAIYKEHRNSKNEYDAKVAAKRRFLEERIATIKNQQKVLHAVYLQIRSIGSECRGYFELLAASMTNVELNRHKRVFNRCIRRFNPIYRQKLPNPAIKTKLYAAYLELFLFKHKLSAMLMSVCVQLQVNLTDLLNMDRNTAFHRIAGIAQNKRQKLM